MQHRRTRTLIGVGERKDGVLFFQGVPKVKVMALDGESCMDLWHKRMGHPLEKVLRALSCINRISYRRNKDGCEICLRVHHINQDLVSS